MPIPKFRPLAILFFLLLLPNIAGALQKGEAFPAITGTTLDGSSFELTSLKEKPVLIKIGTTWCGTCQEQAKTIGKLSDYLKENGIHYIEIFIQEKESKVRKYFQKQDHPMPNTVILDDGDISRQLNVYLIPRVILLDKDHNVYRDGDTISGDKLKKELQTLLDAAN